jgi:predicted Zn-dependent protease
VTSDPNQFEDTIRDAIKSVAGAHLFCEERVDVRMALSSSGDREIVETRTRGAAISGGRTVHVTDPAFLERRSEAMTAPILWVPRLEGPITEAAGRASKGRRNPRWSAKVVSFRQEIWVGPPGREPFHDVRRGCRVEFRVRVGSESTGLAVRDLVLRPDETPSLVEAFSRAFDRAESRASSLPAPDPGATQAVLAPGVAGIVSHELIGHALEGDRVVRGSTWIRAESFPAAGTPVTVVDDPGRGRGAWVTDDEGVAATETTLIDRGRPVGMLLDRASATALGMVSTGHGRRSSYLENVRPRMGCTFIAPGDDAPEDILRSTPAGVFIRRLAGGHTDPFSGRATFIVSDADRIIDGKLAGPLDSFVMELDGVESWGSIDRVGHDLAFDTCVGSCVRDGQPMAVSVGAPTIRIGVVRVRS